MITINKLKKDYTLIIPFLLIALFSNIRLDFDFFIIRLFDILTIIIFFFLYIKKTDNNEKLKGLNYLLPFFFIHILFSYKVGFNNLLKELIQMIIIIFFILILLKVKNNLNLKKTFNYLIVSSGVIIVYVIYYHISNGIFAGWKTLPDTRVAFTIFTILFFLYFKINKKEKEIKYFISSIILFTILIYSGERKAQAIFIFLFLLNYFKGIGIRSVIIIFIFYNIALFSQDHISNPYIKHKIETTLNFFNTGNFEYVMQTGNISYEDTYSNVQRAFSIDISKKLFLENPIFGIGTNNYVTYVADNYSYLPSFMKLSIHGEFQRILVENGLVGFCLYLLIWFKSFLRLKKIMNYFTEIKVISQEAKNYITYGFFLSIMFYVGTEASSLRSFILISVVSILPEFLNMIKKEINVKKNL